jgi:hypothetical protein
MKTLKNNLLQFCILLLLSTSCFAQVNSVNRVLSDSVGPFQAEIDLPSGKIIGNVQKFLDKRLNKSDRIIASSFLIKTKDSTKKSPPRFLGEGF